MSSLLSFPTRQHLWLAFETKQLEDMTARAAQLQEELATVTATSAEREKALQVEVAELRRYRDTIIRERDTSNSILFLFGVDQLQLCSIFSRSGTVVNCYPRSLICNGEPCPGLLSFLLTMKSPYSVIYPS
ncbi:hypothetical protein NE237_024401 [Protea cynaroides]|uniref:Uncharacterized protein n=1 Tax=Protea cynaroides TaxID=273540 RepID=A0A9Q0HDM0_9MAGN|nr:hypothetical protein NE237_024401 [Protea cynaroides]